MLPSFENCSSFSFSIYFVFIKWIDIETSVQCGQWNIYLFAFVFDACERDFWVAIGIIEYENIESNMVIEILCVAFEFQSIILSFRGRRDS